jgi:arsenate reductase
MEGQTPKSVNQYLGQFVFAYTVTVCGNAEEQCPRIFLSMGKHMYWPFEDPAALEGPENEVLPKVRAIRDQMSEKIQTWLREQGIEPAAIRQASSAEI